MFRLPERFTDTDFSLWFKAEILDSHHEWKERGGQTFFSIGCKTYSTAVMKPGSWKQNAETGEGKKAPNL